MSIEEKEVQPLLGKIVSDEDRFVLNHLERLLYASWTSLDATAHLCYDVAEQDRAKNNDSITDLMMWEAWERIIDVKRDLHELTKQVRATRQALEAQEAEV
jgi:CHAD domain-containing protein